MRLKEYPIGDYVGKCQTWNPRSAGLGSFDYIDLSSVDKDTKSIASIERYECADAPSRARQLVETDDVLVATVRPNLNGVALVNGTHHGMTASTGYCVLRPKRDKLDSRFLFHWVKTGVFIRRMVDVATGANYPAVSDTKVKASKIPLPSLAEQKRIARVLDAVDALRAKRREALAQLDTLLNSTFLDMFGDPVTNPMGWKVARVGDGMQMGTGSTPSRKHKNYYDGSIPWVKSTDVNWGTIATTSECVSVDGVKAARLKLFPKGSIVLALYGQGKTRGKCAVLGIDATINQACCALTPRDPASTPYLFQFLKYSYHRLRGESRGGNQENLNMGIVRRFPVPVPPLEVQQRYADVAEFVEKQRTSQFAHLSELDTLFSSLQSRAFRGDL